MLVKLLGLLDFLAGIFIIFARWNIGSQIGLVLAILLIIKSLAFITWKVSYIDLLSGVILLLASTGHYFFFSWIFAIWLFQKSFFSLLS
jgi:hypothetical protein